MTDDAARRLMTVGKVGSPHGLHGEVYVYLTTDSPETRFRTGARVLCHPTKATRQQRAQLDERGIGAPKAFLNDEDATQHPYGDDVVELTVENTRASHRQGRTNTDEGMFVLFEQLLDRDDALWIRGARLSIDPIDDPDEPDAYYPHDLKGCTVVDTQGNPMGTLTNVQFGAAQDLLVVTVPAADSGDNTAVKKPSTVQVLVPFVHQIVTDVDVTARRIVVDPPDGMFPDPHNEE